MRAHNKWNRVPRPCCAAPDHSMRMIASHATLRSYCHMRPASPPSCPPCRRLQDHLVLSGDKKGQIAVWDWQKASLSRLAQQQRVERNTRGWMPGLLRVRPCLCSTACNGTFQSRVCSDSHAGYPWTCCRCTSARSTAPSTTGEHRQAVDVSHHFPKGGSRSSPGTAHSCSMSHRITCRLTCCHRLTNQLRFMPGGDGSSCASSSYDGTVKVGSGQQGWASHVQAYC